MSVVVAGFCFNSSEGSGVAFGSFSPSMKWELLTVNFNKAKVDWIKNKTRTK